MYFQVEKAFREGTARQNAHSIFVSLALKLLEERVHVACKEIITLEKQVFDALLFLASLYEMTTISEGCHYLPNRSSNRSNFSKKKKKKNVKRKSGERGGE